MEQISFLLQQTPQPDTHQDVNNAMQSSFSDCTVTANGSKIYFAERNYAQNVCVETDFLIKNKAKYM